MFILLVIHTFAILDIPLIQEYYFVTFRLLLDVK